MAKVQTEEKHCYVIDFDVGPLLLSYSSLLLNLYLFKILNYFELCNKKSTKILIKILISNFVSVIHLHLSQHVKIEEC
jgi:hypothetical protein